jgi:hypothetical protein
MYLLIYLSFLYSSVIYSCLHYVVQRYNCLFAAILFGFIWQFICAQIRYFVLFIYPFLTFYFFLHPFIYFGQRLLLHTSPHIVIWASHAWRQFDDVTAITWLQGDSQVMTLQTATQDSDATKCHALTFWSRSSSKCYLRIQSVPQREHNTSPLQRSTR